jgi:hypothetical protein
VYDGVVVTDGGGRATVMLTDWFESLNNDFRYQLTVIGQFAQAIVASEINHNTFTIRTGRPVFRADAMDPCSRYSSYLRLLACRRKMGGSLSRPSSFTRNCPPSLADEADHKPRILVIGRVGEAENCNRNKLSRRQRCAARGGAGGGRTTVRSESTRERASVDVA